MPISTVIKVISLENAVERRQFFCKDADAGELPWDFFPAYTDITEPLSYDPELACRYIARPLSLGEIGCYTSHYKVWEWLLQSNYDQIIIFEDDVCVNWPMMAELASYDFHAMGINLLRMHATNRFKAKTIAYKFAGTNSELLRGVGMMLSGAAYILTRAGAEILLEHGEKIRWPADWELAGYWEHKLPSYILFPFPVFTRFVPSSLTSGRKEIPYAMGIFGRLVNKFNSRWAQVLKGFFEYTFRDKLKLP